MSDVMSVKKKVLVMEGSKEEFFFKLAGASWSEPENTLRCRKVSSYRGFPWASYRKNLNKTEDVKNTYIYPILSTRQFSTLLYRQARHILEQGGKKKKKKHKRKIKRKENHKQTTTATTIYLQLVQYRVWLQYV